LLCHFSGAANSKISLAIHSHQAVKESPRACVELPAEFRLARNSRDVNS